MKARSTTVDGVITSPNQWTTGTFTNGTGSDLIDTEQVLSSTITHQEDISLPSLPVYVYFILTGYCIIFIVGGLGNIGTIVAFALEPKLRVKPSDLIILALALADAYICLFEITLSFHQKVVGTWIFGEVFCRIRYVITPACLNVGINLVVVLSWDRFLLLAKQYGDYTKLQTKRMIVLLIVASWICASMPYVVLNATFPSIDSTPKVGPQLLCWPISSFSPLFIVIELLLFWCVPIGLVLIFGVLFLVHLRRRLSQWKRVDISAASTELTAKSSGAATEPAKLRSEVSAKSSSTTTYKRVGVPETGAAGQLGQTNATMCDNSKEDSEQHGNDLHQGKQKLEHDAGSRSNRAIRESERNTNSGENEQTPSQATAARETKQIRQQDTMKKKEDTVQKRYMKPIIMYAALVSALIVCTIPLSLFSLGFVLICPASCFDWITLEVLLLLSYFNSCINPILYALTNKILRQFYARCLRQAVRKFRAV